MKCGQPLAGPNQVQAIPTYLTPAILVTIVLCSPTGIVAIAYAAQVNSKLRAGDHDGAARASRNAKMWTLISFVVSIAFLIGELWWFLVYGDKLLSKLLTQLH